ncbi:MAG: diaminobutyrate acetyltransferase [Maricaulaceae bacterium]
MSGAQDSSGADAIQLRRPTANDGSAVWELVREVGVLDTNSTYAYLLLCRDFADTCVVAERDGALVGFVTGYRPPKEQDVIFVWQVGVAKQARGRGLASDLLDHLLASEGCRGVRFLETTVSPSNAASRALFEALARRLDTELVESRGFPVDMFPGSGHEAEPRLRIGPFDPAQLSAAKPR